MRGEDVTIIIPAFNEAASVRSVAESLNAGCRGAEIVVVNDGSSDATSSEARAAGVTVIDHPECKGYGAALRTGILHSSREFVLFCDADGQHTLEDVLKVLAEPDSVDMVVGARVNGSHRPLLRRPGKFLLARFADFLSGSKIPDLNSGLRILRRSIIVKYLHLMPQGFSFSTTSTFAFLKGGHRIKYVPIVVKRRVGRSTVRIFRDGGSAVLSLLRTAVLFEPLRLFLTVSFFFFLLSLASLAIDLFGQATVLGSGLADTTVILALSTVMVFMTGLLCDQVSALRREIRERF